MRLRMIVPTAGMLTMLCGVQAFAGPVVVRCAPGQHALVRDSFARGEAVTRVQCVGVTDRATTYREPYGYYHARRHRSWGKSALVIGGSAATGAGVGGLIAGKKGALLGAALGGGAGSLYEGAHRR
ncbi:MAG: hypothetical protein DMF90_09350 [Acidobacteria bacterium]|nr:MAG: hypothetical protein DMF90_09350 [Acidobacteriota bacterium]